MPNQRPDPSRRPRPAGQPHSRPQARAAARRRAREADARRRAAVTGAACLGILALVVLVCVFLLFGRRKDATGADTTIQPAAAPAESVAEPTPEPTPAMSEEEQRIAEVMATASANATKDAPVVTDPATWNERGKALMDRLSSDEFFVSEGIDVTEK